VIVNIRSEYEKEEAQQKQAAAEQALEEVKERLQARQLSPKQREQFQAIIREGPKRSIRIVFPSGDYEAYSLVEQFVSIFSSEGWQTGLSLSPIHFVPDIEGIVIQAADLESAQPYISVLQRAFEAINMAAKVGVDDSGVQETLLLIVGHKPSR